VRLFLLWRAAIPLLPVPHPFSRTLRKGWDSTAVSRMGFSKPHALVFFIAFFLHRTQTPVGIAQFPDSAASKTAPRDGPKIRRKTIFGGSLKSSRQVDNKQLEAATPHPEKCTLRLPVSARFADAKARESKARCRYTDHSPPVAAVKHSAIPDLASRGAGFVPEKIERGARDFVQQLIVGTAIRISLRLVKRLPPRRPRQRRKTGQTQQPQRPPRSASCVV
jgi:hypothetical protein